MNNYGEPIYSKDNIKIGYKINTHEFASIDSFNNAENQQCNKVLIKEFVAWLCKRTLPYPKGGVG